MSTVVCVMLCHARLDARGMGSSLLLMLVRCMSDSVLRTFNVSYCYCYGYMVQDLAGTPLLLLLLLLPQQ